MAEAVGRVAWSKASVGELVGQRRVEHEVQVRARPRWARRPESGRGGSLPAEDRERTSGSIGGFGLGLELVGLGSWAAGVSASGLPMQVTAARSLAFGSRTPW